MMSRIGRDMVPDHEPIDPIQEIKQERIRQDEKWGIQNHPNLYWLGILVEEVGELSKAIIERPEEYSIEEQKELIQCAAVCIAWLECANRNLVGKEKS